MHWVGPDEEHVIDVDPGTHVDTGRDGHLDVLLTAQTLAGAGPRMRRLPVRATVDETSGDVANVKSPRARSVMETT